MLSLLQRRPCTLLEVAQGLNLKPNEAIKLLDTLEAEGRVRGSRHGEYHFYQPFAVNLPVVQNQTRFKVDT